jgi:FHS family L-fucose permease-like MFS transporter
MVEAWGAKLRFWRHGDAAGNHQSADAHGGGEGHFAFFSVLGQLVFGLASFISPPWVIFYWGFAAIFVLALITAAVMKIPEIDLKREERPGAFLVYAALLNDPRALLFFLGIAAYVGTEQILANWMSQFLSAYHGVSPLTGGAQAVAEFWGLMSLGCLVGLGLLKLFDSKVILQAATALAIVCVGVALIGECRAAIAAFPASGFFLSVVVSIIFSLALNSIPRDHGAFRASCALELLGAPCFR